MNNEIVPMDEFFKSEEHKLIFALLYTDTSLREKLLGISEELYMNKTKAKEWRNSLEKKLHPDVCKIEGADKAVAKINELFSRMTEDDIDDGENDE